MDEVFRPWDADDEEYAARLAVRELLPGPLRAAVRTWMSKRLDTGYNLVSEDSINAIQSSLAVALDFPSGRQLVSDVVGRVQSFGDQTVMRVVDFLLSNFEVPQWPDSPMRAEVAELGWHLDQNRSAVKVAERAGVYRLTRRLTDGVEEVAVAAWSDANASAGRHLKKAWDEIRSLEPDTSAVMTEAIRAVEAAGASVVIPEDKRPQLAKIVSALKSDHSWSLTLPRRDDDYPDQREVLIGMLEVLVFAERQRHSGAEPGSTNALAHVELASTLVGWFSNGVVCREC